MKQQYSTSVHKVPLQWCTISHNCVVGSISFEHTVNAEQDQEVVMQIISLLDETEPD